MKAKFNPTSPRAIAGLKFQSDVLSELRDIQAITDVEDVRDYFSRIDPSLTHKQITILEKTWGDITFLIEDKRYWVECCFAMGDEHTSMCEIKRKNFTGSEKWYCWGKRTNPNDRIFIPSLVWKTYLGRTKLISKNGWRYRTMATKYIGANIRAAKIGITDFVNCLL